MDGYKEIKTVFVVAHAKEARAAIDYYKLTKNNQHTAVNLFENDEVSLIVAGQGKFNTTLAIGYCGALYQSAGKRLIWVNVGIAGYGNAEMGSLFRVNKVIDAVPKKAIYPVSLLRGKNIEGATVITVAFPESQYQPNYLYDMEASAFFESSSRFSTLECIQSFKIISDNKIHSIEHSDHTEMMSLIQAKISLIDRYVTQLRHKLDGDSFDDTHVIELNDLIKNKFHLTTRQDQMVTQLMHSLRVQQVKVSSELLEFEKTDQLITFLNSKLHSVKLSA